MVFRGHHTYLSCCLGLRPGLAGRTIRCSVRSIRSNVSPVCLAQGPPQGVLAVRHHDQMHVIGHQAIGPHLHVAPPAPLAQQRQIRRIIVLAEERLLPPVATLRRVVRHSRNHHSRQSGHAIVLLTRPSIVKSAQHHAPKKSPRSPNFLDIQQDRLYSIPTTE